ncbi:MAG: YdeI/OmpD-associated family protein [Anaerolineae bacterium]|nr:YdeI/OmpD-associated family protein [Anaerolineae bacterium]
MQNDELLFEDRDAFREWLLRNHDTSSGFWMVLGKAGKLKTLTADEALEEALCFGWIDGQLKSVDDQSYLKRFTPRRKGSVWSERNRELAHNLIEKGVMTEAGQAAIDRAKGEGTWERPGPAPISDAQVEVLIQALSGAEKALANFLAMPPSVQRTYTALYLDAKKEDTRTKRLQGIIERLNDNKKPM